MVKGEHLRPLLGFVLVCCTAALVLASGLQTPALRHLVANPPMLSVPQPSDLVLGQTLDGSALSPDDVTSLPAGNETSAGSGPAAEQRAALVLSSFLQPAASSTPGSVRIRTVHIPKPRHHATKPQHAASPATHPTAAPASGSGTPAPSPGTGGTGTSPPAVVPAVDVKHHGVAAGHLKHAASSYGSPHPAVHNGWSDTRVQHTQQQPRVRSGHTPGQSHGVQMSQQKSHHGVESAGLPGHGSNGSHGSHDLRGGGGSGDHGNHGNGHGHGRS